MASASASADYHTVFQSGKRDILPLFDAETPSPADISTRLLALRSGLNENLAFLPAYDRRNYDLQLKELETRLSQLRAKDKPKSRFAFSTSKSKQTPTVPAASSTSTSTPLIASVSPGVSPVHLVSDLHHRVVRAPVEVDDGYTISISSLSSCIVDLRPRPAGSDVKIALPTSLHAKNLRRCVLVVPVMEGSAIMEGLEDCLVVLGAQQSRIHSSTHTTILLHVPSTPIIEHSSSLHFGAYPDFLNPPAFHSTYDQVQDFDWVRDGKSPNWDLVIATTFGLEEADEIRSLRDDDEEGLEGLLEKLLISHSADGNLQRDAS